MKTIIIGLVISLVLAGCTKKESSPQPTTPPAVNQQAAVTPPPPGALAIQDLNVGTGAEAAPGKTVVVHYTGTLPDGKKFDSSRDRGQPFSFPLGAGRVIQGWDKGLIGMKVGGKRKLNIPPDMAYGPRGMPPVIPPNSPLIFEVELLEVK